MSLNSLNVRQREKTENSGPIRVAVVEDSAVIRGLISRWLNEEDTVEVVARYPNGKIAVDRIAKSGAEVVILDIEMPEMDGITALPILIKQVPGLKVIMASTLTMRNATVSMKALSLGAADCIAKPESVRGVTTSAGFRRELVEKVDVLGKAFRQSIGGRAPSARGPGEASKARAVPTYNPPKKTIKFRKASLQRPHILAVGSSTGGPQALMEVFKSLRGQINFPVVITQHMPPSFTTILATHLAKAAGVPAKEGEDGEVLKSGTIYVAPGNFHMVLEKRGAQSIIRITEDAEENFCRPAVDPMFRSVARIYGAKALAVILTGMGSDGENGGGHIADAGGTVIVQDQATSVVWGMPGAAANAGACSAVLPLNRIGPVIHRYFEGVRR